MEHWCIICGYGFANFYQEDLDEEEDEDHGADIDQVIERERAAIIDLTTVSLILLPCVYQQLTD